MASQSNTAVQQWEAPQQLAQRIQRMHELQKDVMKRDVDYGTIPGTNKPTLYKPGAELLKVTFGLSDRVTIEDLGGDGVVHYRVLTELSDRTGMYLGCGYGECSSDEEKYKWRKAVCDEEWEEADLDSRRTKYAKGRGGAVYTVKQIRTQSADVANTILKMAKKRSEIDAVLNTLGASRIYNQDLEDMSPELRDLANEGPSRSAKPEVAPTRERTPAQQPRSGSTDAPPEAQRKKQGTISDKQVGRIYGIATKAEIEKDVLNAFARLKFGHDHLWQLSWRGGQNSEYSKFCDLLESDPEKFAAYVVKKTKEVQKGPAPDEDDGGISFLDAVENEIATAGYVEHDGKTVDQQISEELEAEFDIHGGLKAVPPDQMGHVFDHYHAKAEAHTNANI